MDNLNSGSEVLADVVNDTPGKRNRGTIIGFAVAAIAVIAIAVYAAVPAVRNSVRMAVMKPEKYCAYVYQVTFDKAGSLVKQSELAEMNAAELTLRAETDDSFMDTFRYQADSELFSELVIDVKAVQSEEIQKTDIVLEADGRHVISADTVSDGERFYIRIPEASEKYLSCKTGQNIGNVTVSGNPTGNVNQEEAADIIKRYGSIITEYISDSSESKLQKGCKGTLEGVNYKYNQVTSVFSSEAAEAFMECIADELSGDESVRKLYESSSQDYSYDEMINILRTTAADKFVLVTSVDANGIIRGVEFVRKNESDEDTKSGFLMAADNASFVLRFYTGDDVELLVQGTETAGRYTGEIKADNEDECFTVSFEDISAEDGKFITGKISSDISELTGGNINRAELLFERADDSQIIKTEVSGLGEFELGIRYYRDDETEIIIPEKYTDIENADEYFDDIDTEKVSAEIFEALGVDDKTAAAQFYSVLKILFSSYIN